MAELPVAVGPTGAAYLRDEDPFHIAHPPNAQAAQRFRRSIGHADAHFFHLARDVIIGTAVVTGWASRESLAVRLFIQLHGHRTASAGLIHHLDVHRFAGALVGNNGSDLIVVAQLAPIHTDNDVSWLQAGAFGGRT